MRDIDEVKWALIDLLKFLASLSDHDNDPEWLGIYGPEFRAELVRIAGTLGVDLPPSPQVEDEAEV